MNPIIRGILAVLAGVLVGGFVNMIIIRLGPSFVTMPESYNPMNMESLKASMHLFEVKHFIPPFLAHAIGTLVGAFLASLIAASHNFQFAIGISAFFFLGGLAASFMLPAPPWFIAVDLIFAYLPMGWLGWKLSGKS